MALPDKTTEKRITDLETTVYGDIHITRPVDYAVDLNITLTPVSNGFTINVTEFDGQSIATNTRYLLFSQTNQAQNGIYYAVQINPEIIIARTLDYITYRNINNAYIEIINGTYSSKSYISITTSPFTLDSTPIVMTQADVLPADIVANSVTSQEVNASAIVGPIYDAASGPTSPYRPTGRLNGFVYYLSNSGFYIYYVNGIWYFSNQLGNTTGNGFTNASGPLGTYDGYGVYAGTTQVVVSYWNINFDGSVVFAHENYKINENGDTIQSPSSITYTGDPSVDGSWRQYISGNDLVFERLESSAWVEKNRITA